jgi:hypothetical protein
MKRFLFVAAIAAITIAASAMPGSAAPKDSCFSGSPGTCTYNRSSNSVTLDTTAGGYAGTYVNSWRNTGHTLLSSVSFSFRYTCDPADDTTSCVGGGSPRWSIPIDTNGDKKTDGYAFVDAANCGSTGTVDTSCPVFFGAQSPANWAAFAAANPTYAISNAVPFVIVDTSGFLGLIYNITFSS